MSSGEVNEAFKEQPDVIYTNEGARQRGFRSDQVQMVEHLELQSPDHGPDVQNEEPLNQTVVETSNLFEGTSPQQDTSTPLALASPTQPTAPLPQQYIYTNAPPPYSNSQLLTTETLAESYSSLSTPILNSAPPPYLPHVVYLATTPQPLIHELPTLVYQGQPPPYDSVFGSSTSSSAVLTMSRSQYPSQQDLTGGRRSLSFDRELLLSCFVIWFCGVIFGLFAFILASG